MKIYCILLDTVPRHGKIRDAFNSKGVQFSDHITCSSTVPTLITMFGGKTPTEMFGIGGVGHSDWLLIRRSGMRGCYFI